MRAYKLLLLGVCALSVCALQPKGKTVNAVNKLETTLKEEVIYQENFESYEANTDGEAVFQNEHFMWFNAAHHDSYVKEYNNSKAMEYTLISDDGYGYAKLGGLGTNDSNNLEKLVTGETYTLSMDIDIETTASDYEFFIEYQTCVWTGVKLINNGVVALENGTNTKNVVYEDGHLEFSFVASPKTDGTISYVTFTAHNMEIGDMIHMDNIAIKKPISAPTAHSIDFENSEVGTSTQVSGDNGIIYNTWNESFTDLSICGDNTNKYLKATKAATGSDNWPLFYLNNLWSMKSGVAYRLEFDVVELNCVEFYLGYNGGYPSPSATYNSTSYVGTSDEKVILGGSFDGKHLTYDFIPNESLGQFWPQVAIILKHNAEDAVIAIDNIRIYELSKASDNLTLDLTNVKTTYYVGEALDLSGLSAAIVRKNQGVRPLTAEEYILDTTNVNMSEAGLYQVNVSVVDEFGTLLTANIDIQVVADSVTSIEVTANPIKNIYAKGQELKLDGLEVTGTYASGRKAVIANENVTVSGYDKDTLGKQTLTVSYLEKTATFEVTVVESVKDAILDVQTKAALAFDYKKMTNGLTEEVSYTDFKNFSIELFYELDLTAFVDVEEIGLCYVQGTYEFVGDAGLPEGAVTAKVANNAGSLTLTIENITDLSAIYSASVYVKTADGTYHYGKAISYSVATMITEYAKISDADYAAIILGMLGNLM